MRTPLRSGWSRWWHLGSSFATVETHVAKLQAALAAQGSLGAERGGAGAYDNAAPNGGGT
jgi:hypothetical protein